MRPAVPFLPVFVPAVGIVCLLGLAGCSGPGGKGPTMPDPATVSTLGPIKGTVFGGATPISGSRVYVLQAGTSGYGSKASSLITTAGTGQSATYPIGEDTASDATNGLYFVTTDSSGAFDITGDYTCTPGNPVYLYAAGGNPNIVSPTATITGASTSRDTSGPDAGFYVITFSTTSNQFVAGQSVVLTIPAGNAYSSYNGQTVIVSSENLSSTSFDVIAGPFGSSVTEQTFAGSASSVVANNPGIVELAVLGTCPAVTAPTLGSTIKTVNVNEISTIASAYALAGFTSPADNDAVHIGVPSSDTTALTNIQNAVLNAAQLYNIQGGPASTSAPAAFSANATTPNGAGTVSQELIDALGNVLNACVASNNSNSTSSAPNLGVTGAATTPSTECTTLFSNATVDGTPAGAQPTDIATAAINTAHFPGGSETNYFAGNLFNTITGDGPFGPTLGAAPNDFTIGITFAPKGSAANDVVVDKSGDIWLANTTGGCTQTLTELTPLGAIASTTGSGAGAPGEFNECNPQASAIDTAGNVWTTSVTSSGSAPGQVYELTSAGATTSGSPFLTGTLSSPLGIASDGTYTYVADTGNNRVLKLTSTGTQAAALTNPCLAAVSYIALDASGNLWADSATNNTLCQISLKTGTTAFTINTGLFAPGHLAIDAKGNAWVPNYGPVAPGGVGVGNSIVQVTPAGVATTFTGGGLSGPSQIAIDSNGYAWVTNLGTNSLSVFSATVAEYPAGTPVSDNNGLAASSSVTANSSLAFDGAGNLWVTDPGTNQVTVYLGLGGPVLTPLSAAVAAGTLAAKP
jgi:sugar lactone lactonase YvrE